MSRGALCTRLKSAYPRSAQSRTLTRDALISYTPLNYSHLRGQAEFMNGKAPESRSLYTSSSSSVLRHGEIPPAYESSRKRKSPMTMTSPLHHGHGLRRFWIGGASRGSQNFRATFLTTRHHDTSIPISSRRDENSLHLESSELAEISRKRRDFVAMRLKVKRAT